MSKRALFVFAGTPTLRRAAVLASVFTLYSVLAVWKERSALRAIADHPSSIYSMFTAILGLMLVFRTNGSYARWWEARVLWGTLVNCSRNLAIKTATLTRAEKASVQELGALITAFPYALKEHLRGRRDQRELPERFKSQVLDFGHQPNGVAYAIVQELNRWRNLNWFTDDRFRVIDQESRQLLEVCGGCERILNTPLPRSYIVFLHQCVFVLLAISPWGLVEDFQLWVIPITFLQAYTLLGIECIAEAIEEPFGLHDDDLELEKICRTIERTVMEIVNTTATDQSGANTVTQSPD